MEVRPEVDLESLGREAAPTVEKLKLTINTEAGVI